MLDRAPARPFGRDRAGLTLKDIGLVEIHEAFAGQVLANLNALASAEWCKRQLGLDQPVGRIPKNKINNWGGSLSIGHPFGATGGRILTTLCNELKRRGGQFGLMTVCAAGGMGHAMVVERA